MQRTGQHGVGQIVLRGTVNSDSEVTHDFFDREDRGESVPMNFVSLEHREHTWAAGTAVSGQLNDFRVAIMMWLKAQNKTPDDEWLTW